MGKFAVELPDLGHLRRKAFFIETIGHSHRLRVIRDAKVFEAQLHRFLGHFLQRVMTIRRGGVIVKCPAKVRELDQARQLMLCGRFNFTTVFPQFGFDK